MRIFSTYLDAGLGVIDKSNSSIIYITTILFPIFQRKRNPCFDPNNEPIVGSRMFFATKHRFKSNVNKFEGQRNIKLV